jgi:hypothetical protein
MKMCLRVDSGDLPAHAVHPVKLRPDCNADSLGMAFTMSHAAYIGRIKFELFSNASEKPPLHLIDVQ